MVTDYQEASLIRDIKKAIHAEYSAIICYQKLGNMAPTELEKRQIAEIRRDEKQHLQRFTQIYQRLTGKKVKPQVTESCPDRYVEGLEFSFKDEQESVDFYLDIADRSQDASIRKAFRRAAKDEQNHAVWFLYFFTKHST